MLALLFSTIFSYAAQRYFPNESPKSETIPNYRNLLRPVFQNILEVGLDHFVAGSCLPAQVEKSCKTTAGKKKLRRAMLPSAENYCSWANYPLQRFTYRLLNIQSYTDLFHPINLRKSNKYFLIKHYAYRFQGNCSSSAPLQWDEHPTLGSNPQVSMCCLQPCKTFLLSAAGPKRNVSSIVTTLEQDGQACRFLWLRENESCTSGRPPPPPQQLGRLFQLPGLHPRVVDLPENLGAWFF